MNTSLAAILAMLSLAGTDTSMLPTSSARKCEALSDENPGGNIFDYSLRRRCAEAEFERLLAPGAVLTGEEAAWAEPRLASEAAEQVCTERKETFRTPASSSNNEDGGTSAMCPRVMTSRTSRGWLLRSGHG